MCVINVCNKNLLNLDFPRHLFVHCSFKVDTLRGFTNLLLPYP